MPSAEEIVLATSFCSGSQLQSRPLQPLEEYGSETVGEPVAVAIPRPAPNPGEQMMQIRARKRKHRLERVFGRDSEWPIGREGVDEPPQVRTPLGVQTGKELGELGIGAGGTGEDREDRPDALESRDDVGHEEPQLRTSVCRGDDSLRAGLLEHGRRIAAAHRSAHERAEERALVVEPGVHGLGRHAGLGCDRRDRRPLETPLRKELRGGIENPLPRLLGLLATMLGAVAARLLDISGQLVAR